MDFGGGWPSHLLDDPAITPHMAELLTFTQNLIPTITCVQFEPGKSLTERAGAMFTRIIEIRDADRKATKPAGGEDSDDEGEGTDNKDEHQVRAAVVEACIYDLGSMPLHTHSVMWLPQDGKAQMESPSDL